MICRASTTPCSRCNVTGQSVIHPFTIPLDPAFIQTSEPPMCELIATDSTSVEVDCPGITKVFGRHQSRSSSRAVSLIRIQSRVQFLEVLKTGLVEAISGPDGQMNAVPTAGQL